MVDIISPGQLTHIFTSGVVTGFECLKFDPDKITETTPSNATPPTNKNRSTDPDKLFKEAQIVVQLG